MNIKSADIRLKTVFVNGTDLDLIIFTKFRTEFDSTLESTDQISHVTNFSFSDWSIFERGVKFYAGILLIGSVSMLRYIVHWTK